LGRKTKPRHRKSPRSENEKKRGVHVVCFLDLGEKSRNQRKD
jgi:hypothetical protein